MGNIVCCSTGKARVYYIVPGKGGLQYKLKGQSTWKKVLADEPLTTKCEDIPGVTKGGQCRDKSYKITIGNDYFYVGENRYREDYFYATGKIDHTEFNVDGDIHINSFTNAPGPQGKMIPVTVKGENNTILSSGQIPTGWDGNNFVRVISIIRTDGTSQADDIAQCGDGDKPTKKFTVLGESGRKYAEIEVKECPDVQTVDCIFDEKNTKSIDIEMVVSPYVEHCLQLINGENYAGSYVQINNLKRLTPLGEAEHRMRPPFLTAGPVIGFSPKGCPIPKVWIECCPNGICGEDKKCPKETVCQVDCEGFRCCYDGKGNLIKKIKL